MRSSILRLPWTWTLRYGISKRTVLILRSIDSNFFPLTQAAQYIKDAMESLEEDEEDDEDMA